jgi:RNA polymerase sigma-70 factor (ECF subfamily)
MSAAADSTPSDDEWAWIISKRDQSPSMLQAAQAAFRELYQRHAPGLLAFLASRCQRSDLEDTHQEIWRRIWEFLPRDFRGGQFRAWLFQIARYYLIDRSRKRNPERLPEDHDVRDDTALLPDEAAIAKEYQELLARCLKKLTAEMEALVRARLAGESYAEICDRLAIKQERLHKLFHTAKEQLQSCVEGGTR